MKQLPFSIFIIISILFHTDIYGQRIQTADPFRHRPIEHVDPFRHTAQRAPNKVKGYTADGDSIITTGTVGNPNPMWTTGYTYWYSGGYWYRKDEENDKSSKWSTPLDWGLIIWRWRNADIPSDAVQYYERKPDTPLGDFDIFAIIFILMIYAFLYINRRDMYK